MITASALIDKLRLAVETPTVYAKGGFGSWVSRGWIDAMATLYPSWYAAHRDHLLQRIGCAAFDCVCLVKGILWGWDADRKSTTGGSVYGSNGVPDTTCEGLIEACDGGAYSDDVDLIPGELLYLPGHVAVYIGDGKVIEANLTEDEDGVCMIPLGKRRWTRHGRLPWVSYDIMPAPDPDDERTVRVELRIGPDGEIRAAKLV